MTDVSATVDSPAFGEVPEARVRRLQRLATALAIVGIGLAIVIVRLGTAGDVRFRIGLDLASIAPILTAALFPAIGALIVHRRPTTRVAWLMIVMGVGLGIGFATFGYGAIGIPPPPEWPGATAALVVSQLFFVPVLATCTTFFFLLFPADRLLSPPWRWVGVLSLVGLATFLVGSLFHPGGLDDSNFAEIPNPLGLPSAFSGLADALVAVGNAGMLTAVMFGMGALVIRYRRGDTMERAQIRWIALVGAFVALSFVVAAFQVDGISDRAWELGFAFLALMPIAIGLAITRYHLYDIDRLINRTLLYGSLTAILAGIFTAGIGLAQRVFVATTGESSDAAIVLTTLVVATSYAPLRKRLEELVDRWFKYEERRFGAYRDEVDRVLGVIEPGRAAERIATEAVRELEATGGAVVDADDVATATAGTWPVPPAIRLQIPGGYGSLHTILVGPRRDGRPHDPRTVAQLEDVAGLAASAVRAGERQATGARG
jgi:hypothetical protein